MCHIKLTRLKSETDKLPIFRIPKFPSTKVKIGKTSLLELPRERKLHFKSWRFRGGACSDCSRFVTPYSLGGRYRRFGETYLLNLQCIPWRWRWHNVLKRWCLLPRLHGVTNYKDTILVSFTLPHPREEPNRKRISSLLNLQSTITQKINTLFPVT